jgi:hypothetical protein
VGVAIGPPAAYGPRTSRSRDWAVTERCYDPGRMSIEAAAPPPAPRPASRLTSVGAAIGWLALASVLALGSAGLVGELTHPPGSAAREELTFPGDRQLAIRLDDAARRLRDISTNVDTMSAAAKAALASISSGDTAGLKTNVDRGSGSAVLIVSATRDLRDALAGLPGDAPDAVLRYSNATLVRRATILAALDAATGLGLQWAQVTGRSQDAATVVGLLQEHDSEVAAAAALGVQKQWSNAVAALIPVKATMADITSARDLLVSGGEVTILDEWIARSSRYDDALTALYQALDASNGKVTLQVQAAAREEQLARAQLPPDARSIIVIVSQIAQGGLNQAVLAIEDARARIDDALAAASPS